MRKILFAAICVFLILSCKKEKPRFDDEVVITELKSGLPSDKNKIHAYLYSFFNYDLGYHRFYKGFTFACFGDPGTTLLKSFNHYSNNTLLHSPDRKFQANIEPGVVRLDTSRLKVERPQNDAYYYKNQYSIYFLKNIPAETWSIEGNHSFVKHSIELPPWKPFDSISNLPTHLKRSRPFTIPLNSFKDFDSLCVTVWENNYYLAGRKTITAKQDVLMFYPSDLNFTYNNIYFQINAFKYYNQSVNEKVYVYERSVRFSWYVSVGP